MAELTETVVAAVGPRLRGIRKRRGVTLEQLAERTGISVSTLSRLESGKRRPTLELLLELAREHRVPLDDLVGAPVVADPRIHPRPVSRNGSTWIPLNRNPGGISAYKQILPALTGSPAKLEQQVHDGYEWLYVLSGSVRLALGTEQFVLTAGEAAEFDTTVAHAVGNATSVPAELVVMFSQQGDRMHLRATARATAGRSAAAIH